MTRPYVLSIDIGTSSCRAIVFDSTGNAVDGVRAQIEYHPDNKLVGQSTFAAETLLSNVCQCLDLVLAIARSKEIRISAVGTTCFWHSMIGLDRDLQPATPIYTWADTRAASASDQVKESLDLVRYRRETGTPIHPCFYPSKLQWLSQNGLDINSLQWLSPTDYIYFRLFGKILTSHSMASGTGLYDQHRKVWSEFAGSSIGLDLSLLPNIIDTDSPFVNLRAEFSSRWPELRETPWIPAIGDGAASNLGSGCTTNSYAAINLGTSGAIRVLSNVPTKVTSDDLWRYRLDSNSILVGGAFSDGGDLLSWMKENLNVADIDQAISEVSSMEADTHGLTLLPFFAGERSIGWSAKRSGCIAGLTMTTRPVDILRCTMESVAFQFARVFEKLKGEFPCLDTVIAAGGAFKRAPVWGQIMCDCLNHPLILASETEATSRGAASTALKYLQEISDWSDVSPLTGLCLQPSDKNHSTYLEAMLRQQKLYELTA